MALGGPGCHVLGATQPGVAAEFTVDIGGVLGANQPSVFEYFLPRESLELTVMPQRPHLESVVPLTTLVGAIANSGTQVGAS